LYIFI